MWSHPEEWVSGPNYNMRSLIWFRCSFHVNTSGDL